jgi:hypothetical protein
MHNQMEYNHKHNKRIQKNPRKAKRETGGEPKKKKKIGGGDRPVKEWFRHAFFSFISFFCFVCPAGPT